MLSFSRSVIVAAVLFSALAPAQLLPEWQVNQAGSALDLDGVFANAFSPAILAKCPATTGIASFAGAAGQPWEAGLGLLPLVPRSNPASLGTAGGQVVNLDVTDPALFFLNGGPVPALIPFPGNFAAVFGTGAIAPFTAAIQQLAGAPALSDGFALSQACQLDVVAGVSVPGPFDDDGFVTIALGVPPLCGPSSVPFYGTAWTGIHVASNGRVLFGTPDPAPTPTIATALGGSPYFGVWGDLDPSSGGSVVTTVPAPGTVAVAWSTVPYFASVLIASFTLQIDAAGTITMSGLTGLQPSGTLMFRGLSAGAPGATNAGATAFNTSGVPVAGPPGQAMIYDLASAATLAASGVNVLTFIPQTGANYLWIGN